MFDAEQSKKKRPAHVCARASHHGTSLCWVDRGAGDHDLRNDEVRLVLASILMPSPRRFPPPWSVEDIGAVLKQQSRRRRRKPTALPYRPKTVPWSCRNGVVGVIEPTVRNSPLRLTRRNGQPRRGRPVRLRKDSTNLATTRSLGGVPGQAATCRLTISTQRAKGWYSCVRPCECGFNHIGRN